MDENNNIDIQLQKKSRASKAINILTALVLAIAVILLIEALYTNKHMHNNYFGNAVLPVASQSMDTGKGSIKKGDLIFVKILGKEQKSNLKEGDIITFKYYIHELDSESLITHRIVAITSTYYVTHGDANPETSVENVSFDAVVGVYRGKVGAIGHIGLFFETKVGSFIMVVVPFLALLALSAFQFVRSFRAYNRQKLDSVAEEARASVLHEEKERLRQEILAELKSKDESEKST